MSKPIEELTPLEYKRRMGNPAGYKEVTSMRQVKAKAAVEMLLKYHGVKRHAAKQLGVSKDTFRRYLSWAGMHTYQTKRDMEDSSKGEIQDN